MTIPTPAQLRAAADLLGKAASTTEGGITGPTNLVLEAEMALGNTLPAAALDVIGSWRVYDNSPDGWRWMVQAARLRLLVEASGPNIAALGAATYAWWQEVQGG